MNPCTNMNLCIKTHQSIVCMSPYFPVLAIGDLLINLHE